MQDFVINIQLKGFSSSGPKTGRGGAVRSGQRILLGEAAFGGRGLLEVRRRRKKFCLELTDVFLAYLYFSLTPEKLMNLLAGPRPLPRSLRPPD